MQAIFSFNYLGLFAGGKLVIMWRSLGLCDFVCLQIFGFACANSFFPYFSSNSGNKMLKYNLVFILLGGFSLARV